jgi:hypothetical protein
VRQWLQQHVFHNFGIKVLAVSLAVIVYLHVFTSQEREVQLEIPLELQSVPAGLIWSGEVPAMARVRFRGIGIDLVKLRSHLGTALLRVDVSEARAGLYQRPLVVRDVSLSRDLRVAPIEVMEPRAISLRFDREGSRRLAVTHRLSGRAAPGFMVYGRVIAEPESVVLDGPATAIDSMRTIPTAALDVTGQTDMVTRRVALLVPAGSAATPAQVTVRAIIEKVASRTIAGLAVDVLRSRGVRLTMVVPETGTVRVNGPSSLIESLSPDELRVSIDARGLPPGGVYSLMASVELRRPGAAGLVAIEPVQPEKFEVELQ